VTRYSPLNAALRFSTSHARFTGGQSEFSDPASRPMSPPETPTAAACVCVSTEEIRGKPFARFSARAFLRSTMRAARRAALFADLETHADEDEDAPCSSFS